MGLGAEGFQDLGLSQKIRVPYFGILIIRILLLLGYYIRVPPLFSETPIWKLFELLQERLTDIGVAS